MTITLDWDATSKRWKLVYLVKVGRAVVSHWRWIETSAAIDALTASRIADAVQRELEAALF